MRPTVHYCTYFDERYLTRGLALYASMRRYCQPFRLYVLCMTVECYRELTALALPDVEALTLENLEHDMPDLVATKAKRSAIEYYFTCTSNLISWLFNKHPEIDVLTYLDADLFFFQNPDFLFASFEKSSVLIVPHRFSPQNRDLLKWGIYNVGWVTFRRDENGLACLDWWRRACLDWCHDFVDGDRFADQRYLDVFPQRFSGVQIDGHPGVNLAPWNLGNYQLTEGPDGKPLVDGEPVVFFHFHRFRQITRFLWRTSHRDYGAPLDARVRRLLYAPYLEEISAAARMIASVGTGVPLRRDAAEIGAIADRIRAVASIAWRGGGLWIARANVL
jgi:hypothetical protein